MLLSTSPASVMSTASHTPLVKQCVLYNTNRTYPVAPKTSPGCPAPGRSAWSKRIDMGDLARLRRRLVPESGYIHREEAPPIDAGGIADAFVCAVAGGVAADGGVDAAGVCTVAGGENQMFIIFNNKLIFVIF